MRVIRNINALPKECKQAAVAIGNFDGLHKGHLAVLRVMMARAEALKVKKAVLTFEPHPKAYFDKEKAPKRLMRVSDKLRGLRDLGVEIVYVLRFNQALAELPAEQFIHSVLAETLAIKDVSTGEDFVFGKGRLGNVGLIKAGAEFSGKYSANAVAPVIIEAKPVSSSRIRQLLAEGNIEALVTLLGREYTLKGRVIAGDKRARALGYPTANIALPPYHATPAYGVYIVEVQRAPDATWEYGVAHIGVRPTFGGSNRPLLEVHLLDQSVDLYGSQIAVRFIKRLREEKRFESVAALAAQIARDAVATRQFFRHRDADPDA